MFRNFSTGCLGSPWFCFYGVQADLSMTSYETAKNFIMIRIAGVGGGYGVYFQLSYICRSPRQRLDRRAERDSRLCVDSFAHAARGADPRRYLQLLGRGDNGAHPPRCRQNSLWHSGFRHRPPLCYDLALCRTHLGHTLGVFRLAFRSADEREPRADLGYERRGARLKSRSFGDTA